MGEFSHALDFLLDVFDKIGFLCKLLLIDAFDRVDLIVRRFEFNFFC